MADNKEREKLADDDHNEDDAGLSMKTPFVGIIRDVKRTVLTHWKSEMINMDQKVIAVSFFLFFACITPAIAFGGLYEKWTHKWIGVTEMIAATAWCGIVYALIGGMPIFINGGTGPVLAFSGVLYTLSESMEVPFLVFNAWVGIWVGIYLVLAAIFNLNRHVHVVSRFTDEIFAGLISAIFIISAAKGLYSYFQTDHKSHEVMIEKLYGKNAAYHWMNGDFPDRNATSVMGGIVALDSMKEYDYSHHAVALLSLFVGVGTCYIAILLRGAKKMPYFVPAFRNFLADFGTIIAILTMALIDIYVLPDVHTERLSAPNSFAPTFECCDKSCRTLFPDDCSAAQLAAIVASGQDPVRRPWFVDLSDLNGKSWVVFFAAVPALLAFILVFLDDGITWHLVNKKDNKLTHGTSFHWDTVIIAMCIVVNSLFGLPWLVAATVRSINHVQAMATKLTDSETGREFIDSVHQTRLTGLFIHLLVLVALFAMPAVKAIPMPALYGIFLYMGLVSLWTNQAWNRVLMVFMQPSKFPTFLFTKKDADGKPRVSAKQIHKFTLIQIVLFVILYVVKSMPSIAITFPVIIALCIPVRAYLLPKFFTHDELAVLDAHSEEEPAEGGDIGKERAHTHTQEMSVVVKSDQAETVI